AARLHDWLDGNVNEETIAVNSDRNLLNKNRFVAFQHSVEPSSQLETQIAVDKIQQFQRCGASGRFNVASGTPREMQNLKMLICDHISRSVTFGDTLSATFYTRIRPTHANS